MKDLSILHLKIGDRDTEQIAEVKLLGITIDSTMSWNRQIDQMVVRMGRCMAAVKHCRNLIPSHLTKQLVQALVLSQTDYCPVIWFNTTDSNLHKLQVSQNKAARMILRCPYRTKVS